MKKYIVIGGRISSKNDGDIHYINARKLCDLYKVNPQECYLIETHDDNWQLKSGFNYLPQLPILQPQFDGNYNLLTN